MQKSSICPGGIEKIPNPCTEVAFDNFDRFLETKSGKDTLHDTVGIIHQNVDPNTPHQSETPNLPPATSKEPETSGKRRRRTMDVTKVEGEQYMKKLKMTDDLQISIYKSEKAASNDNITDHGEDDALSRHYHDWLNDENSNDYHDDDQDN